MKSKYHPSILFFKQDSLSTSLSLFSSSPLSLFLLFSSLFLSLLSFALSSSSSQFCLNSEWREEVVAPEKGFSSRCSFLEIDSKMEREREKERERERRKERKRERRKGRVREKKETSWFKEGRIYFPFSSFQFSFFSLGFLFLSPSFSLSFIHSSFLSFSKDVILGMKF